MKKNDAYQFSFEKLEIWQLSRKLVKEIYRVTAVFPAEEKFGLITQLRRAAVSVSSNIAEGTTRRSLKEQAYMIERSFGSLIEVLCQLILSSDLTYLEKEEELNSFRVKILELSNKINAYVKFLRDEKHS